MTTSEATPATPAEAEAPAGTRGRPRGEGSGPFAVRTTLAGFATILAFCGLFALWLANAPLEGSVISQGAVSVGSNVRTVQHLEGGVVEEINVRDGDRVAPGDILVRLRPVILEASVNRTRAELYETLAAEARLIAERDRLDSVAFPEVLVASAASTAREAQNNQRSIFASRRNMLTDRTQILQRKIAGLDAQIEGLEGQISATEQRIALIETELGTARLLLAEGLANRPRVLGLEREKIELEGQTSAYRAEIGAAREVIEETRLRIIDSEAEWAVSIVEELRQARAKAYELQQTLASAEDVLERTIIRAPAGGVVVRQSVHTIGGVVRAGEPLMDIVPDERDLVVMANIDARDIDQVRIGQDVAVWLSATHRRNSAALKGTVARVSADAIGDPVSATAYYIARIELVPESFDESGVELQPGMAAEVMIRTGVRSAWSYIAAPIRRGMSRAMRES